MFQRFQKFLSLTLTLLLVVAPVFAVAPTQNNVVKNGVEDTPYVITLADFTGAYNDPEGDALQKIEYDSQIANAQLQLLGVNVVLGQEIAVADIPNLRIVPNLNYNGTTIFGFSASDGTAYSSPQSDFIVNFSPVQDAPTVANPIPAQAATQNIAFNFACAANTFNDPDGDVLTLTSTRSDGSALPLWLTFTPATCTFSGTPANSDVGVVSLRVTANDGNGGTVFTDFNLTVSNVNDAPILSNAIPDQVTNKNQVFNYAFPANTFTDIDVADVLTYSSTLQGGGALPAWLVFTPATRTFSGTPGSANVGVITIDVIANDGNGGTITDTFQLTVNNAAPTQANVATAGLKNIPKVLALAEFSAGFIDADNDTIQQIEISTVPAVNGTLTLSGAPLVLPQIVTAAQIANLTLTPANNFVGGLSFQFRSFDGNVYSPVATYTTNFAASNVAPTLANAIPDQVAVVAQAFSYAFPVNTFSDADGDALTYSATLQGGAALPAWVVFTPAIRTFAGTPAVGDVGAINITVTASDGLLNISDTFQLTVNPTANAAPTLANAIPDQVATVAQAFSYAFPANTFNDANGDVLTYSATLQGGAVLPAWVTFTPATRTFAGTPAVGDVGAINITVTANDGNGGTVSDTFQLTVNAVANVAPTVVNAIPDQTATAGSAFSYSFPANTFNDANADPLTYSSTLQGGAVLPAWVTFTSATRTFAGTPAAGDVGAINITVTANDGNGGTVSDTFQLTVNPAPGGGGAGNNAPNVANAIPDQVAIVAQVFSYAFPANTFNDIDGNPLSYSATLQGGGALPAWVTFTPATRTFAGTPAAGDVGAINVTVTANDGQGGVISDTFRITINPVANTVPTVANAIPDQIATVAQAFSYAFPVNTFTDADGNVLTYTATLQGGAALPAWVVFTPATRTFAGTPAAGDVGAINVTVTANDGNGGTVSDTFQITVNPVVAIASSGGGGGGGGGNVLPDFSSPYKLICPSSITKTTIIYTPIDFEKAQGEFCQTLIHENYYQHHKVVYEKGTKANYCSSQKPFDDILYTAKSIPLSQSKYIPVPKGKTLIRVVDLSSRDDDDICFSGKTLPEFTIRFYIKNSYDPKKLSVYRYEAKTKTLELVTADPKVDTENGELTLQVKRTGIYVVLYGEEAMKQQQCFLDMENNPAKEDVFELLSQGVIDCKENFYPNMGVTRAEITKFALKAFKRMKETTYSIDYPDVTQDQWYYPYIQRATEAGIVHGYPHDGYFRPAQVVKRGEALKITLLASEFNDFKAIGKFTDTSSSDWYYQFAAFSYAKNILDFIGVKDFDAGQDVTRAEIATMLVRMQEVLLSMESLTLGGIDAISDAESIPVNTPTRVRFQVQKVQGGIFKQSGIPVWCQFSLDQKEWNYFGTLAFTNENGIAQCPVQVTRPATLYFRGFRSELLDSNMGTTSLRWE